MNSFELDLGLERYKENDSENSRYIAGGVKIRAGEHTITKFQGKNSGQADYLGTYIDLIWMNIASTTQKLDREKQVNFEIMTEGWDPEFVIQKNNTTLRISMSEESANWSDEVKVPEKYVEGIEVSKSEFIEEILDSGRELKEFYEGINQKPPHISNLNATIKELEDLRNKINN